MEKQSGDQDIAEYMLRDYAFLEDYEVLDAEGAEKTSFVAFIKDTEQKVRFVKRKFSEEQFPRFKALHRLYKSGIILADNMFILEECDRLYFYVIEAELESGNSRFSTLQDYLYAYEPTQQDRKEILTKIKILVDCLHQEGQPFAGIDPRKIILDDDNNIYLAPFQLDFELPMDSYSRAYYSPQVLEAVNRSENEISEQIMLKWDIWSFGCIALEILLYSSPVFLATSTQKQLSMVKHVDQLLELRDFEDSVKYIINNSLTSDMASRTISTSAPVLLSTNNLNAQGVMPSGSEEVKELKATALRQLNIHQGCKGDSTLELSLIALSNVVFERQLRLSIRLGKGFHLFVDFDEKRPKKHMLNRKITLRGSFQEFEKWLVKPVVVELKEGQRYAQIQINLQSLVFLRNGSRVWSQPVIGTYSTGPQALFPCARLKVSCLLKSLEKLEQINRTTNNGQPSQLVDLGVYTLTSQQSNGRDPKRRINYDVLADRGSICNQMTDNQIQKGYLKKDKGQLRQSLFNQKVTNSKAEREMSRRSQIPTISEISQEITAIAEGLKRKMQRERGEDEVQKKLTGLLGLQ